MEVEAEGSGGRSGGRNAVVRALVREYQETRVSISAAAISRPVPRGEVDPRSADGRSVQRDRSRHQPSARHSRQFDSFVFFFYLFLQYHLPHAT